MSNLITFRAAPIGAFIRTDCGQTYVKRSSRTLEMAPQHSHYMPGRWFYANGRETFRLLLPTA